MNIRFKVSGSKLRAAREKAGLKQNAAAKLLGLNSSQHLLNIEEGCQRVPVDVFLAMLVLYKVKNPFSLAEDHAEARATQEKNLATA